MSKVRCAASAVAALALVACAQVSKLQLRYEPPPTIAAVWRQLPPLRVADVSDARGVPQRFVGRVMGAGATRLETERPVADVVRDAFDAAIRARQPQGGSAVLGIGVKLLELESSTLVRREANAEVEVSLRDGAGQTRFAKRYRDEFLAGGVFDPSTDRSTFGTPTPAGTATSRFNRDGTVEAQAMIEKVLRGVIDKALDDPELQAALRR